MGLGKGHRHDLSGPPVIVTENVEDYRKAIAVYLNKDDVVLELGCAQGVTTTLIGQVVREVIGIDKSPFNHQLAQSRNPNVEYFNLDAFDPGAIIKLGRRFTAIFIDVSGNRTVGDVVSLVDSYNRVFSPRVFVVKCYKLKRLMGMCRVFPEDVENVPGSQTYSGQEHVKLAERGGVALNNSSTSTNSGQQGRTLLSHALMNCSLEENPHE